MKSQMSAFDIHAFVSEASSRDSGLVGLKLDKVFQPDYSQVWLRFSGSGGRKFTLVIHNGRAIWFEPGNLTTESPPPHFAMLLRKHIGNRTLISVSQHHFDRIVIFDFSGEERELKLIVELFGKGNMVLVEDGRIVRPLTSKTWKHRDLKSGAHYEFPPEGANPMKLSDNDISEILTTSGKDLVRTLAANINLGGSYAEAVCELAGLHKSIPANDLEDSEMPALLAAIAKLRELASNSPSPIILSDDEGMVDVLPFALSETQKAGALQPSFNAALKIYFEALPDLEPDVGDEESPEVGRMERQVEQQEVAVAELEARIVEMQAAGDRIYANYAEVERVLKGAAKVLESNDWPEAKSILESQNVISLFEPGTGKLDLTLSDGSQLSLDVRKDVNENAAVKYDAVKRAREKLAGAKSALAESRSSLENRRAEDTVRAEARKRQPTKRFWFESYRWFISSEGYLVIGGRDARTNDKVVKKHLGDGDIYVHAETQGAPSVVVKEGKDAGEATLQEACEFALCFSKAWKAKLASGSAYWVRPGQVSKTPQPGEFLARGAFVIRGKRNYSKKLDVRLAIGEVNHEGERKIMCGPVSALENVSADHYTIEPGDMGKNQFAKQLAGHYNVPIEEILSILPPGDIKIVRTP